MTREKYWHCPKCGGLNVVTRIWVDANKLLKDRDFEWDEGNPSYCTDCDEDVWLEYGPVSEEKLEGRR